MKFELLAGRRALGSAHTKDYTDWAESLLYGDVESNNVAMLASIGLERGPDSEEIEVYFQKCLKDLGLILPTKKAGLKIYAKSLCEQIVSGELESEKGLNILETFYSRSDYEAIYSIWDELAEDIWMVNNGEDCIWNTGLTIESEHGYVKDVAAQFIVILEAKLPSNFFHLSACSDCGHIGKSRFEVIDKPWMPEIVFRLIYKRSQTQRAFCSNCKKPFPTSMSDYESRKKYLSKKC